MNAKELQKEKTAPSHSVRDEMCYCGHLRSNHEDPALLPFPGLAPGHGKCSDESCDCVKFTWKSFVDLKGTVT